MHHFLLIFVGELLQVLQRCHLTLLTTSDITKLMGSAGAYVTEALSLALYAGNAGETCSGPNCNW